jgi:hypothetical protein
MVRGDDTQRAVAHVVQLVVICHVAGTDQFDTGFVHATL